MLRFSHSRTVAESLREYGRGIAGGLMFSLPLLYTMEVWEAGCLSGPGHLLAFVAATFLLLLLYNRFAGLRRDASWWEVAIDSVEEMGIGVVLSAAILWITDRVDAGTGFNEALGMITVEAMTVAIGVSVGTAQLGAPDEGDHGVGGDDEDSPALLPQLALAFCGAVLFAANIAPTDEVAIIASEAPAWKLLVIVAASLAVGSVILHFSDFVNAASYTIGDQRIHATSLLLGSYVIALGASAASLALFGQFSDEPAAFCAAKTIVLGFPAMFGASAGRLLLQSAKSDDS